MKLHLLEELREFLLRGNAIELKTIGLSPEYIGTDCFFLKFPHPFLLPADRCKLFFRPLRAALPIFHITFSI